MNHLIPQMPIRILKKYRGKVKVQKSEKVKSNILKEVELLSRTFNFGLRVIKFFRTLPENHGLRVIKNEWIKAATSVGTNYEEAQGRSSKADFIDKVKIVLKESKGCHYWLWMFIPLGYGSNEV